MTTVKNIILLYITEDIEVQHFFGLSILVVKQGHPTKVNYLLLNFKCLFILNYWFNKNEKNQNFKKKRKIIIFHNIDCIK